MTEQNDNQNSKPVGSGGADKPLSRRKVLAGVGLAGAAIVSSELLRLGSASAASSVHGAVYGGGGHGGGLRAELADQTDSAKGAALVGYSGRTVADKLGEIVSAGDRQADAQLAADSAGGKVYLVPQEANILIQVPAQYPDLNAALRAIESWIIPASAAVRIQLAAGHHVMPGATRISHPYAEQIQIKGADVNLTAKATAQVSVTGAAGEYFVSLAVTASAGLAAGDWVMIRKTAGSGNHYAHVGFWEVTAAAGSQITVRNRHRQSSFPTNALTSADIHKVGTILKYTGTDGIVVRGASVGLLEDVGIVGNMYEYWNPANVTGTEKGTHGIYVGSNTIINGAAAPGGENPLGISGGSISLGEFVCVSQFDQQGLCVAGGSGIYGKSVVSTGNGRRGFYVGTSSAIEIKFCIAAGNYLDGVIADYGGCFNTSGAIFSGNRQDGGFAFNGGSLVAPNTVAAGNAVNGFEARAGAQISVDGATAIYNGYNGINGEYGGRISCTSAVSTFNARDGLALAFGAVARATNINSSSNTRYGVYCDGGSTAVVSGATTTANAAADRLAKQLSFIQDGAAYTPGTIDGISRQTFRNATAYVDETITSGGDLTLSFNGTQQFLFKSDGTLQPSGDGTQDIGTSANRFRDIYAANGLIQTSDERLKQHIDESDLGLAFVAKLKPVKYERVDDRRGQIHYGLLAQDVERLLQELGMSEHKFAALNRPSSRGDGTHAAGEAAYGLRYTEFIAPLIKAVQELAERVNALEAH